MPRSGLKRPIESIDLTQSNGEGSTPKAPRLTPLNTPQLSSRGWSHRALLGDDHHDEERNDWLAAETVVGIQDGSDVNFGKLMAMWDSKVVGVRYYNGIVTAGEIVSLIRDPGNPFDKNAIRVDNVAGAQVGHIPRGVAEKLAPFFDDGCLFVEARLIGSKDTFDAPLRLHLYGSSEPDAAAVLLDRLSKAGVPSKALDAPIRAQKQAERARKQREQVIKAAALKKTAHQAAHDQLASQAKRRAELEKRSEGWVNPSQQSSQSLHSGPSMEDIMNSAVNFDPREIGRLAENYGAGEDTLSKFPMAAQPLKLATKLLPYQLQGLQWMINSESPILPVSVGMTSQLWRANALGEYTNVATNFTTRKPILASGGILADDMGLGKTIQVIALLVADPNPCTQPTLIVAPVSVMSNWAQQAKEHVDAKHSLKVLIYHGTSRKSQTQKDFEQYDVVITTYQTLALEYLPAGKKEPAALPRKGGLLSSNWRRIVLDEGHTIRSPRTKLAQAAYAISAQSRWVLTGTPIVNNLRDLYSHIKFLRLTGGLQHWDVFNSALIRPLKAGAPDGSALLQALMSTLCLRRMKDMKFIDLKLPNLTSHRYTVKFLPEEKKKYEAFKAEAQGMLQDFQSRKNSKGEASYSSLLEVLLRMRQTCNHWRLCSQRTTELLKFIEGNERVTRTPKNIHMLQDLLQLSVDQQEDCAICLETLHNPVITLCGHFFGAECIERVIETQHKCPMCRNEIDSLQDLVKAREETATEEDARDIDTDARSSKIDALLDILTASHKKAADTKTVVFSQWSSYLNLLEPHLQSAGFKFCRLDGTMNAAKRDEAIYALNHDPNCCVLLATLGVCSVGLNLVAANQVILSDSWWSPAIEDQAVDRVHRLGQTRPTTVFRLVMEDSIEDKVLDIQSVKRKLMMAAFGEKKDRRAEKGARLADIKRLLR